MSIVAMRPRLGLLVAGWIGLDRLRAVEESGARSTLRRRSRRSSAALAVFCQKPRARTAAEAAGVVEAARAADRVLSVEVAGVIDPICGRGS